MKVKATTASVPFADLSNPDKTRWYKAVVDMKPYKPGIYFSRRYLLYWGLIGWTLAILGIGWLLGGGGR